MDLEASLLQRLENLRQWQIEQQERLLKQQQIQREMLTHKQDSMFKALEFSMQELALGESMTHGHDLDASETHSNKLPITDTDCKYDFEHDTNELETDVQELIAIHKAMQKNENYMETSKIARIENTNTNIPQQQRFNEKCTVTEEYSEKTDCSMKQSMMKADCDINNFKKLRFMSDTEEKNLSELSMDGVVPLSQKKAIIKTSFIDDVPIPSPRKDFKTLLEERLKDYESVPQNTANADLKVKTKKPFLRKGQGLSRFRLNRDSDIPSANKIRSCTPLSNSMEHNPKHKKGGDSVKRKNNQATKKPQSKKNVVNSVQQPFLKNTATIKGKVTNKSESYPLSPKTNGVQNRAKNVRDLNSSDLESKSQKELEEMRIFELLEEKAENSSFCSTSSAVLAFMQQSTPFKIRQKIHSKEAGIINRIQQFSPSGKSTNDRTIFRKISQYEVANQFKQQSTETCTHQLYEQTGNPYWDSVSTMPQNNSHSPLILDNKIIDDMYTHIKDLQESDRSNTISTSVKNQTALRNNVQLQPNQQSSYDTCNPANANDVDVSFHVRFAEYNEYKTIGLTDTSTISNESITVTRFSDEKVWDDSFSTEVSDTDTITKHDTSDESDVANEQMQKHACESKSLQCNMPQDTINKRCDKERQNISSLYSDQEQEDNYPNDEESELSDTSDQPYNVEQTISSHYSSRNLSPRQNDNYNNTEKLEKHIDVETEDMGKYVKAHSDQVVLHNERNKENIQVNNATIFKSELLKNRLLELEKEIDIFRKENAALSLQRGKLQEDHKKLRKEYADKERNIEEGRKQAEDRLQEERKKLAREKAALESRIRDAQEKAQQSKLERQEIQSLREDLEKLKEELNMKECRWNAAQSRQKCQMRILKMENTKLKQELERIQNVKKNNIKNKTKPGGVSNAKAIHQINRQLQLRSKETPKIIENSSSESDNKLIEPALDSAKTKNNVKNRDNEISDDVRNDCDYISNKSDSYEASQKAKQREINTVNKRHLYEQLLKEATADLTETHREPNVPNKGKKSDDNDHCANSIKNSRYPVSSNDTSTENSGELQAQGNESATLKTPARISRQSSNTRLISTPSQEVITATSNSIKNATPPSLNKTNSDGQGTREVRHPDGRIEYWYPNGNVKKVFPDQGTVKMLYYNGDVRETEKDGKIKYFYASTRTWHTTMPDGLEILEFPDGQVERRSQDGTVEVAFSDGSVRILQTDGTEKWALTDGTIVQTLANGEKVLTLPNGQREIHTKDHKRREYPDGTVKLVYPDGTQETRYSNGRIRLKDKDGNLLMDSY